MMLKAATILSLFTTCICQFVMDFGMKPDVTFGEQNERFDVASIIQDQSRMDKVNTADDYRRQSRRDNAEREDLNNEEENERLDEYNNTSNAEDEKEQDKGEALLDALKETVKSISMRNFASSSNMDSSPDDNDYEKNLAKFGVRRNLQDNEDNLNRGHNRRAPPDPENEILFHYGVPIHMKVEGSLQVPLENK